MFCVVVHCDMHTWAVFRFRFVCLTYFVSSELYNVNATNQGRTDVLAQRTPQKNKH